uniref:MUTSd domain-containing protein n=1 Tax=Schistosoma mansoni TaxID=6183 RepID=A0A3Q0KQ51_SCHMA
MIMNKLIDHMFCISRCKKQWDKQTRHLFPMSSCEPQLYLSVCIAQEKIGLVLWNPYTHILQYMPDSPFSLEDKWLKQSLFSNDRLVILITEPSLKFISSIVGTDKFHISSGIQTEIIPQSYYSEQFLMDSHQVMSISFMPNTLGDFGRKTFIKSLFPANSKLVLRALSGLLYRLTRNADDLHLTLNQNILDIVDVQLLQRQHMLFVDKSAMKYLQIIDFHETYKVSKGILPSEANISPTLFKILNHCLTTQGTAELRKWMGSPISSEEIITRRLDAVEFFLGGKGTQLLSEIRTVLKRVGNTQKIILRMQTSSAIPSDWRIIIHTLDAMEALITMCKPYCEKLYPVQELFLAKFDPAIIGSVKSWLIHVIDTEKTEKEQRFVVRRGVDTTLDKWNETYACLPDLLSQLAEDELGKLRENIRTCGLIYFPLFTDNEMAYYRNETTRILDQRYGDVMYAIVDAETTIMHHLQDRLLIYTQSILQASQFAAEIDCLCAFAMAAKHMEWTRPKIVDENCIHIYKGWYPIQQTVSTNIIKNSFYSDGSKHKITLLTGPNGSGKSIYMKTIALITYLTHIGSYIPAEGAKISTFDAIHILTGTDSTERDNCSTYMMALQMASVALRNLTSKTLIIMDEFAKSVNKLELDALTIAMAEFLLLKNECPYTIIATHNHKILRQLQMYGPQVQYLTMRTVPHEGRVVCLYEAVNGLNLRSEAISTANAIGLPEKITERALSLKDFLSTIPTSRMKNRNKR